MDLYTDRWNSIMFCIYFIPNLNMLHCPRILKDTDICFYYEYELIMARHRLSRYLGNSRNVTLQYFSTLDTVTTLPLCLPYSLFVVSLLGRWWAELGGSSATWETPGPGVSQDKYTTSPFMEKTLSMQTPLWILLCFLVVFGCLL